MKSSFHKLAVSLCVAAFLPALMFFSGCKSLKTPASVPEIKSLNTPALDKAPDAPIADKAPNAPEPDKTPEETAPEVIFQPKDTVVPLGHRFTLSVAAKGSDPLSYQWFRDGEEIPGATAASYTGTAAYPFLPANFTVRVKNDLSAAVSQPANVTISWTNGSSASLDASATGKIPASAKVAVIPFVLPENPPVNAEAANRAMENILQSALLVRGNRLGERTDIKDAVAELNIRQFAEIKDGKVANITLPRLVADTSVKITEAAVVAQVPRALMSTDLVLASKTGNEKADNEQDGKASGKADVTLTQEAVERLAAGTEADILLLVWVNTLSDKCAATPSVLDPLGRKIPVNTRGANYGYDVEVVAKAFSVKDASTLWVSRVAYPVRDQSEFLYEQLFSQDAIRIIKMCTEAIAAKLTQ
ncbi:MAG: immunoglobulin domain-containing protein [Opitutaceae bacterium]|jgi:hypothetical protein|nr:immunoglobulin domain-containing protein [Opitutaceae bacterium]